MYTASQNEHRLAVRTLPLPVPSYTHLAPPHYPTSPVSLSEIPVRYENLMDVDARPPRDSDIDVANTLATMSGRPAERSKTTTTRRRAPASPAWSHSSLASDGTNESVKSEQFVFTEDSSTWPSPRPSPLASCSASASSPMNGSFSSESSGRSLPRLPELDHISLASLASHYASSSSAEKLRGRHRGADYALEATPRTHIDGNLLPPMALSVSHAHQQQLQQYQYLHPHHHHQQQHHQHHQHQPHNPHHPHHHHIFLAPDHLSKPKRKSPVRGTRCNVKYTIEQKDFVDYWRIDRHDRETPWDDVVREYNILFKGPQRGSGGLQSAWYRENKKIPITDAEGLLLFDEQDEVRTTEVPVRAAKGRLHSIKAIGLLSTHPERAIEYSWVTREHKRKIWKIGSARKIQLEKAALKQRQRAEAEARLSRAAAAAQGPDLAPFHSSLPHLPQPLGPGCI